MSGTEYAQAIIAKNARIDQLREALVDLIQNVGGHDHWREGGAGGTCATCERQNAALARAREALNA